MSKLQEAKKIKDSITNLIREVIKTETQHCFKVYKAVVVTAPTSGKCAVSLMGQTEILNLPYSSDCSDVTEGDFVWVAVIGTFSNSIVWQKIDFS